MADTWTLGALANRYILIFPSTEPQTGSEGLYGESRRHNEQRAVAGPFGFEPTPRSRGGRLGVLREDLRDAMDELGGDIMQKAQESGLVSPERAESIREGGVLKPFRWLRQTFQAFQRFRFKLR